MSNRELSLADLVKEIAKALSRLAEMVGNPATNPWRTLSLLRQLGWKVPFDPSIIGGNAASLANACQALEDLVSGESVDLPQVTTAIEAVLAAKEGLVSGLDLKLPDPPLTQLTESLPRQLLDLFILDFLRHEYPIIHGLLTILGVATVKYVPLNPAYPHRIAHICQELRWATLTDILTEPGKFFEYAYGWGTQEYNGARLLDALHTLFLALDLGVGRFNPDDAVTAACPADETLFVQLVDWGDLSLGFEIYRLIDQGKDLGIGVSPYLLIGSGKEIPVTDSLTMLLEGSLQIKRDLGVKLLPGENPATFGIGGGLPGAGDAKLKLRIHPPGGIFTLGSPKGNRLEMRGFNLGLGLRLPGPDMGLRLGLEGLRLVFTGEGGDGFIQKLLANIKLDSQFDLTFGLDGQRGFYLEGSGKFEKEIPLHKSLGPLRLDSLYLCLLLKEGFELITAVSLTGTLGPVTVCVERLGVVTKVQLNHQQGATLTIGDLGLDFAFHPPKGAGLAVEAGPVSGGGYLEFDNNNKQYAGILQLKAAELGLTAIGLITTRMPDGSDGFSMLAILNVEFSPPIQLSMGFQLSAVGGLVGVHRTLLLEVLRDGIRNRTLDSIMFPQDPIQNAPRIISDLRAVFPVEEGRFVIGPMVRIGWGSPAIITAEIAVVLELPMPVRIALLGQVAALLPKKEEVVVELHLDVLGTLEFAKSQLAIDATLYNSRILTFTLTGDAAARLSWGDNPVFALSLGGFHPRFSPPPNFPVLRRLRLSLGSGDNPRLNCDQYQALTSNSLQFGALVEVYARYSGAKIEGFLGFDALFYFSPFSFEAAMGGAVAVHFKGHKLTAVRLALWLSGPTPWYAEGKASFEILCWDVDVHFQKTWGPTAPVALPAVDPWEEFKLTLERPESWGSRLPEGRVMVETLRSLKEPAAPPAAPDGNGQEQVLLVHPTGGLEVRQKVLPLAMRLSKFGNAPISGHYEFDIEAAVFDTTFLEDYFARGQYEEMSQEDQVSKPSYELLKTGRLITIKPENVACGTPTPEYLLEYESVFLDEDNITQLGGAGRLEARLVHQLLAGAAANRSPLRTTGRQKYLDAGRKPKTGVKDECYTIVWTADMTRVAEVSGNDGSMTRWAADAALRKFITQHPKLVEEPMVVPSFEVAT